jgi:hypothetical protein
MKLCYAKITIELVKKLIGYEHPQPHFLLGPVWASATFKYTQKREKMERTKWESI